MGRPGKIERLPLALRDELGERYLNGASFKEIAAWINNEPEAIKRWELHFKDNPKLDDENLSAWKRDGGFARWKEQFVTGQLAERCFKIAQASGGNITRGAAAILGGQILAGVEALADGTADLTGDDAEKPDRTETLVKLAMALKMTAEAEAIPLKTGMAQDQAKRAQASLDLDKAKFQRTTCEMFVKFYNDKVARDIAAKKDLPVDRKLALLAKHFWGEMPEGVGPMLPPQQPST